MNYAALTAELAAGHPSTGVYSADAQTAANEINAANITRIKASMTGEEVFQATVMSEYKALGADKKAQWLAFTNRDSINPEAGGRAQEIVVDIFGAGSQTVAALAAARNETVSRATVLGLGRVRAGDIIVARS